MPTAQQCDSGVLPNVQATLDPMLGEETIFNFQIVVRTNEDALDLLTTAASNARSATELDALQMFQTTMQWNRANSNIVFRPSKGGQPQTSSNAPESKCARAWRSKWSDRCLTQRWDLSVVDFGPKVGKDVDKV